MKSDSGGWRRTEHEGEGKNSKEKEKWEKEKGSSSVVKKVHAPIVFLPSVLHTEYKDNGIE